MRDRDEDALTCGAPSADVRPILNERGELVGAERVDGDATVSTSLDPYANPLGLALNDRREKLARVGKRVRKFSRGDVQDIARRALGPAATFREIPVPGNEALEVYGVVEAPGYHKIVNQYSRLGPGEGRRRVVSRLGDAKFLAEARK